MAQDMVSAAQPVSTKVAWTIEQWADDVGLCRMTVYNLFAQGRIASVKAGKRRLIVTSPAEYVASLPRAS